MYFLWMGSLHHHLIQVSSFSFFKFCSVFDLCFSHRSSCNMVMISNPCMFKLLFPTNNFDYYQSLSLLKWLCQPTLSESYNLTHIHYSRSSSSAFSSIFNMTQSPFITLFWNSKVSMYFLCNNFLGDCFFLIRVFSNYTGIFSTNLCNNLRSYFGNFNIIITEIISVCTCKKFFSSNTSPPFNCKFLKENCLFSDLLLVKSVHYFWQSRLIQN